MLWLGSTLQSQTELKTETYFVSILDVQKDNCAHQSSWERGGNTACLRTQRFPEKTASCLQQKRLCREKCVTWLIFVFTQKSRDIPGPVSVCVLHSSRESHQPVVNPKVLDQELVRPILAQRREGGFTRMYSTLITVGISIRSKSNNHIH